LEEVLVKSLTKKGGLESVFSLNKDGIGVLHAAACTGQLEVCKYLVEKLGADVNAPGCGTAALGPSPSISSFLQLVFFPYET
jgi:ankyrin repeat protein